MKKAPTRVRDEREREMFQMLRQVLSVDPLHLDAQKCLGRCYYKGEGVQQDYKYAKKWYTKAAEQGDT